MAVVDGTPPPEILLGYAPFAPADTFTVPPVPTAGRPGDGEITDLPIGPKGTSFSGQRTGKQVDAIGTLPEDPGSWWFDRIHFSPSVIALGNLISARTIELEVFSSYRFDAQDLDTINLDKLGAGVSVTNATLPQTFQPLADFTFEIEFDSAGPAVIDGDIEFDFGGFIVAIAVSGLRIVLFEYHPERNIAEQWVGFTDIQKKDAGPELRHARRQSPRRKVRYTFAQDDAAEASRMRNILLARRPFLFALPIWSAQRTIQTPASMGATVITLDTADIEFRAGAQIFVEKPDGTFFDALVVSFDSSSITVQNPIPSDIPVGSLVMPVEAAYITRNPTYSDAAFGYLETIVEFESRDSVDLAFVDLAALQAAFTTFDDDLPILADDNLLPSANQARTVEQTLTRLDSGFGIAFQRETERIGNLVGLKGAEFQDLAGLRKWVALVHWLRVSQGEFYLPTFRRDLVPLADFALNAGTITVELAGVADSLGNLQPRSALMLELPDGRQFFSAMTGISANENDAVVSVAGFGVSGELVTAADARISFLEKSRIDGDVVTILHEFAGRGQIEFSVRSLQ